MEVNMKKIMIGILTIIILSTMASAYLYFNPGDTSFQGHTVSVADKKINFTLSNTYYLECNLHDDGRLDLSCFGDLQNCIKDY